MHYYEYGISICILYEERNGQLLKELRVRYPLGKPEFSYVVTFLQYKFFTNSQEVILHL
jgi:hypothetical protein